MPDYTLLPVVKSEIVASFNASRENRNISEYAESIFEHIRGVNPNVAIMIERMTNERNKSTHPDRAKHMWTFCTVCAIYRLLESQAEANAMDQELA